MTVWRCACSRSTSCAVAGDGNPRRTDSIISAISELGDAKQGLLEEIRDYREHIPWHETAPDIAKEEEGTAAAFPSPLIGLASAA